MDKISKLLRTLKKHKKNIFRKLQGDEYRFQGQFHRKFNRTHGIGIKIIPSMGYMRIAHWNQHGVPTTPRIYCTAGLFEITE